MARRDPPDFKPKPILEKLAEHRVEYVLIGGLAGMLRGSSYPSFDVDIAYARDHDNLERLAAALRDLRARLREAPPDVPFLLDARTLRAGSHFTFETPFGSIDILSDPDGAPPYPKLRAAAEPLQLEGLVVATASLDHLIAMKDASARTKDKLMASELRLISDELRAKPAD